MIGTLSSDYSNVATPSAATPATGRIMAEQEELVLQESFVVYPNPLSNKVTKSFELQKEGSFSLGLYDKKVLLSLY